MGNTPGPDSSPDDEAGLARKRPRSPDPENGTEPGHVPKKQRHTSSISSKAAKPARSSKKRAHSPECDDSLGAGGDGGDIARKRRRPKQEAEQTSSQSRRSAAQFLPTPPPPPPAALLDQEHARSVAHIQRIRSGLQDIERRLARLAQLSDVYSLHDRSTSRLELRNMKNRRNAIPPVLDYPGHNSFLDTFYSGFTTHGHPRPRLPAVAGNPTLGYTRARI
ncbi:unnamed protein product [Clonostachys rhizophaga]|uniref:Uncharacterized protein n=1 Tax=Clonostachys rhizophaga TaxID=160324 RepID=A0A9N9VSD3_9HYPO|nr:unnamed protein product [Clonostachys rhizophaga]